MAELVTVASITLLDKLTGPLRKMSADVQHEGNRLKAAFDKLGSGGAGGIGGAVGGGLLGGAMGHFLVSNEAEYDRMQHRFQAMTELTDQELKKLEGSLKSIGEEFGINRKDMLEGAMAWKEAGGKLDDYSKSLRNYAMVSKITGVTIKEASQETRSLMLAFGMDTGDAHKVKEFEEFFLVASKNIKGGAHAMMEAMKNAAPIAGALHMTKETTAALISAGVAGGFEAGAIGNALKTVPLRLMAPTPKVSASLRAAGVDIAKLYDIDTSKLRNTGPLRERLNAAGLHVNSEVENTIKSHMANADFSQGLSPVRDKLIAALAKSFGMGKGDAQNKKVLGQAVDQYIASASGGLNFDELMKLKNMSVGAAGDIFGKEHAAKMIEILRQEKLIRRIQEDINREAPGAIERKGAFMFQGFGFELDRLQVKIENFFGGIAGTGVKNDLGEMFRGLTMMIKRAEGMDPNVVRKLFWGSTALAALPVAAFGVRMFAASLMPLAAGARVATMAGLGFTRMIAGWAAMPFLAAARGLGALRIGIGAFGMAASVGFAGLGRFAGMLGTIARFGVMGIVGGSLLAMLMNPDAVMGGMKALASTEGVGLLTSKLGEVASSADSAARSLLSLFNIQVDPKSSPVMKSLEGLAVGAGVAVGMVSEGLRVITDAIERKNKTDELVRRSRGEAPATDAAGNPVVGTPAADTPQGDLISRFLNWVTTPAADAAKAQMEAAQKQSEAADKLAAAAGNLRVGQDTNGPRKANAPANVGGNGGNYGGQ